ncbi:uncharacterized protein LOC106644326 [Copidosoma floridanum]|uniref:uncharacterized protein LOC106644326 n=1 Tax=Copidosoma floridanum TaxID=29053 RepID=UPI0006C9C1AA|nr:uncharacterized protein LOC106644326 [Copidosoma floridanum]
MDDFISGADTLTEAKKKVEQLDVLTKLGSFKLRKWSSNSKEILAEIPEEFHSSNPLELQDDHEVTSVLGLNWNSDLDSFSFKVNLPSSHPIWTKRSVLSQLAKFFDLLGWISSVIIEAKMLLQELWLLKVPWDEKLPSNLLKQWSEWINEAQILDQIRIPHWNHFQPVDPIIEIHGFTDTSKRAYAAVLYLRTLTKDMVFTLLEISKTKVAPLKALSIPRLELCGAHLLSKLVNHHVSTTKVQALAIHLYTDSMDTLYWIKSISSKWPTLVANRCSEIQTLTPTAYWHHVKTKENPADLTSRGVLPKQLIGQKLWFEGPDFLRGREIVFSDISPKNSSESEDTVLNEMLSVNALECQELSFLDPSDTLRSDSYCLSLSELDNSRLVWVLLNRNSSIAKLNPILVDGVIRVEGRLGKTSIPSQTKHPLILAPKDYLTDSIINYHHNLVLHGASSELKETLCQFLRSYNLSNKLLKAGTNWHFNPPSAPHFGGLSEAAVKSAKQLLKRVIGDQVLTFRWANEYLVSLQVRQKWIFKQRAIRVNNLVLILQENTPPSHWPLGRVTQVLAGSNESVRVIEVRTATSTLT